MNQIDLSDLQDEVIDYWDSISREWCDHENVGFNEPDPTHYISTIQDWADDILSDPQLCIEELGFRSFAQYMSSKNEEDREIETMKGIDLGYCRISKLSTKFFFDSGRKSLEFYIDRDPETGLAKLWLNPGNTDALIEFIRELKLESERNPKND